ncbi:MAG: hypothetical protein M5U34_28175 [Chloroflexi bacterium]|nr:hypothetical protein [Chloroflexota bacterium]
MGQVLLVLADNEEIIGTADLQGGAQVGVVEVSYRGRAIARTELGIPEK